MRTLRSANPTAWYLLLPATLVLASCSGTGMNVPNLTGPAAAPPAYTADQLAGRYGLAAFQRDEDRTRTEAEARQQCRQPYEIGRGPNGGVIMHLADQSAPEELQLKGRADGKTFIGPEGEAGSDQDREIVSFDGRILVTRWVSSEIASRYGTAIYVRCDGTPPRTKRKAPPKKTAAKAAPKEQPAQETPVFMAPPPPSSN
jgi:hypothetical protein